MIILQSKTQIDTKLNLKLRKNMNGGKLMYIKMFYQLYKLSKLRECIIKSGKKILK